ncbi:anaerobic C4-dicarboxylate transporter DcuA/anaerobic C4-dicarboxylate transporter DcuB [Microterricola gilva]|uniref:Anaerobic C4-dicarboxylate transporter DcuA/anaerobic C4-dicarboxylate transporter DcuB n=1 Tax=Microterricola gilva TaxID=393267 RepID=A0A4Q8ALD5_9MICO|nr:anaerobic C4-dicarboxylate transporter family protein [Microterricola gilva]RZU65372.1 anaerobic C4-dicarboxylate transporter DcuA/anaerobic C4-dicarboxylate transporter DcuB [Microterricola gilva]
MQEGIVLILEALVVVGCIIMGTRASGVGVGLWGGVGVAILVFVFGEAPGEPPSAAVAIIIAVVTAASMMQAAGGIDWMVKVAAGVIESRPKQITLIAPLTAFLFSVGAGTSNILYPLLPVIYDVSYRNGIRPSRPMSVSVVQSGVALAASPVSAAMAAMLTLTDVAPYNLGLIEILAITFPACVIGIIVTALVVSRFGKELADDPEVQEKIRTGVLPPIPARPLAPRVRRGRKAPPSAGTSVEGAPIVGQGLVVEEERASAKLTATKEGRNAALAFLAGVLAIVLFGLFPGLRPTVPGAEGESPLPLDMTSTIVIVMLVVGVAILFVGRPNVKTVSDQSVFKAGMVSAIALFGIAWMTATFIEAHEELIVETVGAWVTSYVFIFAIAVFIVAAMTTSQSTATRTIVPIGLAAGLPPELAVGMWAGAIGGVYSFPTGGPQIAGANFDLSGTTKLGSKLFDHSYFLPMLVLSLTTVLVGSAIGAIFFFAR